MVHPKLKILACDLRGLPHSWAASGRRGVHVEAIEGNQVATYVRCEVCRQCGFRLGRGRVVFTWARIAPQK